MNFNNLVHLRLHNQHIAGKELKTVKEVVSWMGAIQAQDYNMAKWAIGARLPGSTDKMIEDAINRGEIIRTHLLRPTWHFVSANDVYWMLDLTAPQIKTLTRSRNKQLGLTAAVFTKSNGILEKALTMNRYLTRDELMDELTNAGMNIDGPILSHILMEAELDGIICSGPLKGKKITYALLSERVKRTESIPRDEALTRLASRYFTGHGPATLQDFVWWSGLSVTDAKYAIEALGNDFVSDKVDSNMYWRSNSTQTPEIKEKSVYVLPAFDELLIGYKDRSAFFSQGDYGKNVSSNGMFKPFILVNGAVSGVWKRTFKKEIVSIETDFFSSPDESIEYLLGEAFSKYGNFLEKNVERIDV